MVQSGPIAAKVVAPVTLVMSAHHGLAGRRYPWSATFAFATPNENGIVIQQVTSDWSYYMKSRAGNVFLGSSIVANVKADSQIYPAPFETSDPMANRSYTYWELAFVR